MQMLMSFLLRISYICRKELLTSLKDPATKALLVFPVLIQSVLFGYAATYDLDNVPYACIDQSRSKTSADFLAKLDGTGVFYRVQTLTNASNIAQSIDSDAALMVISIGPDFESKLAMGAAAPVQVITDGRNTMTSAVALGYINDIVAELNAERSGGSPMITIQPIAWYNPNLTTRWSFLPGIIATMSLIQVLMHAGLSVAREREQGTFDQLLVAPLSPLEILIGKAVPPLLIGLLQSTFVLLVCMFWFNIPMNGSVVTLYLTLFIFTISCIGIGLSISAISASMQQVMVYSFVLLMPMILLSGLATPVRNMPEALQILTYANPMRFAIESVRRIYLEGSGVIDIAHNFLPMLAVAVVTLPLAAWLFRNKLV